MQNFNNTTSKLRSRMAMLFAALLVLTGLSAVQASSAYAADPVWVGKVSTTEQQMDAGSGSQSTLTQTTNYVLNGANSSLSSTFTDVHLHSNVYCGQMQDDYTGFINGPYPELGMHLSAPVNGMAGAELDANGQYSHFGTQKTQQCSGIGSPDGPYIETLTSDRSVPVYPPRSGLGCASTRLNVPPGIQAIRASVTETCASGSFTFKSTWKFEVKLNPCNSTVDSDNGGLSDCVEFDNGANPQDPDDDVTTPDDTDGDGVPNVSDNCPSLGNADQANLDGDGLGDVCDPDIDGDGLSNEQEQQTGTSPIKYDSDSDGQPDGSDPCPMDPTNACQTTPGTNDPDDPSGAFSCTTPGANRKNYEPTYSVRVKAQAWPDLEMFRFEPLLVACWNGVNATWKTPSLYNFVDGGLDQIVLNAFGFEIAEDNGKRVAKVIGNEAEVSANFNFEFKVSKLFDKLGIRGHMKKRVKNMVAKNLEWYLKKNNVTGPQLGDALRQQGWFISREMNDFAGKFRGKLKSAKVPSKVADPMASWVEDEIKAWTRDYRQWVGAMSRDNAFRDKTADYIAGKMVGKLFSFFDPTIRKLVWRPNYVYTLSKDGAISKRNGTGHFKMPFLTIKSEE